MSTRRTLLSVTAWPDALAAHDSAPHSAGRGAGCPLAALRLHAAAATLDLSRKSPAITIR